MNKETIWNAVIYVQGGATRHCAVVRSQSKSFSRNNAVFRSMIPNKSLFPKKLRKFFMNNSNMRSKEKLMSKLAGTMSTLKPWFNATFKFQMSAEVAFTRVCTGTFRTMPPLVVLSVVVPWKNRELCSVLWSRKCCMLSFLFQDSNIPITISFPCHLLF